MTDRVTLRLQDIVEAITDIRTLVAEKTLADVEADRMLKLLLERLLEIVSEASRHIPQELKEGYGSDVPWRQVAGVGNILRHAYRDTDPKVLWDIVTNDLGPLQRTALTMIDALAKRPSPPALPSS